MLTRRATKDEVLGSPTGGDVRRADALARFRRVVWKYWKENGRHNLPWRKTRDPYRIMVSEVMLQQTQVPRVIEKYKEFLRAFPTIRALARSNLAEVLRVWSGLGYNRRGKYLHDAAKIIMEKHGGRVPLETPALRTLPGMGPYTASAIRVFAYNEPDVLIETNVRAVYIYHFEKIWTRRVHISDRDILPIVTKAATGQDSREWHWALMDYGVYLKKLYKNPARKSAQYVRQSKFEGSLRQIRGAILRVLHNGSRSEAEIIKEVVRGTLHISDKKKVLTALTSLLRDGLIVEEKGKWRIA